MAGGGQGAKGPQAGASSFGGPTFQQPNMNWGGAASPAFQQIQQAQQPAPNMFMGAPMMGGGSMPPPATPAIMPPNYGGTASPAVMPQVQQQQAMQQLMPNFTTGAPSSQPPPSMLTGAPVFGGANLPPDVSRQAVMPPGYGEGAQAPARLAPYMDFRFQQNPTMRPRVSDLMPSVRKPQVQGNPNAMPVQRSPRFTPGRSQP